MIQESRTMKKNISSSTLNESSYKLPIDDELKLLMLKPDLTEFREKLKDYDLNSQDKYGNTLLTYLILNLCNTQNDSLALTRELYEAGINVNARRNDGRTALYLTIQLKAKEIFDYLLSVGANIEEKNNYGNTPLWEAVNTSQGDGFFIDKLLQKGADRNAKNNYGVSPKSLAETIANYDVSKYFTE